MTEKRKHNPPFKLDMPFDEAVGRFLQTDPKEILDTADQIKKDEGEVDRYVAERERSIGRGVRRAPKRFRL